MIDALFIDVSEFFAAAFVDTFSCHYTYVDRYRGNNCAQKKKKGDEFKDS